MPTKIARRAPESAIFAGATAVALLHALDDAFTGREPGVGLGQHALAAAIAVVSGVAAVHVFPRVRPAARMTLAFFFGVLALVNGALHVADHHVALGDVTGVLAIGAGVTLLALAAAIPFVHRGQGTWKGRLAAIPVIPVLALFTTMICVGLTETHKFREPVGPTPAGYTTVDFKARDGVKLQGWYRPTRNGATVIVLHGGGGNRTGAMRHARMLVRHGYGVFAYDARGRGRSEGVQNAFGWGWDEDVAGAIRYLKTRPEVDPGKLAGLGLSTGADVLLEGEGLQAVVADGTAAESFEDWRRMQGITPLTPFLAAEFAATRITSGTPSGPPLEDMVRTGKAPLLLISGGRTAEYDFNVHYAELRTSRQIEHWNLPKAGHTAALRQFPRPYEARVVAFLDSAMSVSTSASLSTTGGESTKG